ncbi:MAG: hypothetical protein E3J43_00870 [Candidatus Heimdallarchaeota archaeon]|nr:MAG: hypothetical protein E3J43_00870 [Candidatus Heimdallarchaeota archaeon]
MINIRIANLMGLSLDSAQHSVAIDETLISIEDTEAFYQFLADKKNGIEYETKPERLLTLSRMYKKLQEQAKLPHETALNFSKQLTHKVEQARMYIKNQIEQGNERPFSSLTVGGHKFFTDKELKALSGLGRSSMIIELSEQHKLEDNLTELFLSKYIAKSKYESLTSGQQRVKKLVGGLK